MKRFPAEDPKNVYSPFHAPVGTVREREIFQVETLDCFGGRFRRPEDYTQENIEWVEENLDIVTGPICVDGAKRGMAVAITIHGIEITTPGRLTISRCSYPSPLDWWEEEYTCKSVGISEGRVLLDPRFHVPVKPIIGCLATAPATEVVLSRGEGRFGGNLDCNLFTVGATILLPVNIPGAFLYFGDCKAAMADGEIVNAPEVGTLITAEASLRDKPRAMRWPRVETPEVLATVVCATSVDVACRLAFREMMAWLVDELHLDRELVAVLMGMVANTFVCQVSNGLHTARCVFPLSVLRAT